KSKQAIDRIEQNARAQGALVNDLLDLSRIVQGRLTLERRLVDLPTLTREAIDAIRPMAQAKGVALDLRVRWTGGLMGDPQRLRQVRLNLLSNAVKFSPSGTTVVTTIEEDSLARRCRVTVQDAGVGIRREFFEHLFEPFSQADPSSTRVFGGLGLGL